MKVKRAHTYTLAPETDKMLYLLAEREGLSKSSWISKAIRTEWNRIGGSILDEAIREVRLQAAEAAASEVINTELSVRGEGEV